MTVIGSEQTVPVSSAREAALLAVLVVELGQVVGRDRLVDELWTDGSGTLPSLRVTANRLRKRCASVWPSEPIRTVGQGYLLDLDPVAIDVHRFRQLAGSALDGSVADRIGNLRTAYEQAEAWWIGEPFADVDVATTRRARRELIELRCELAHATGADLLRSGHANEARTILERLIEIDPYREDAWGLLAVALYRQRRQADALHLLGRLRNLLRDDLGILPSPTLQELEVSILQQHPPDSIGCDLLESTSHDPVADSDDSRVRVEVASRLRAARTLIRAGATGEAVVLAHEVEELATSADDRRLLAEGLLVRAQAAMAGPGDPHPMLDEAKQIARERQDGDLLTRIALTRFGAGVPTDRSEALLELIEPIELLDVSDTRRIDLLCAAAAIIAFTDGSDAAQRLVDEAARTDRQFGSARSRALLLTARSTIGAVHGHALSDLEHEAEEAYRLARELADPQLVVVTIQGLLRLRYARGDLGGVDELLGPLDGAAQVAGLPFGSVRVVLCRTTNAIARGQLDRVPALIKQSRLLGQRFHTYASAGASTAQQTLLDFELDHTSAVAEVARPAASMTAPGVWNAILAAAGDEAEAEGLLAITGQAPEDDSRDAFVAFAAEVAARRRDAELGAWCAPELEKLDDRTVVVGLGTVVLGFARHFAGLGRVASGEPAAACEHFERAVLLAERAGARLWKARSTIELADVLIGTGRPDSARSLIDSVARSGLTDRAVRLRSRMNDVSARIHLEGL